MGWLAYLYDVIGELYCAVHQKLDSAWNRRVVCRWERRRHPLLPVGYRPRRPHNCDPDRVDADELIRNGHQDYEYLRLAGVNNKGEEAAAIARKLYPSTFETITTDTEVDAARRELAGLAEGVNGRLTLVRAFRSHRPRDLQGTR